MAVPQIVEKRAGIEPGFAVWQADFIPLYYTAGCNLGAVALIGAEVYM